MQVVKLSEQAKNLNLAAITISKSLRYGMFSSLFVGQGIDFDSCREYELNDDIRYIDWNLTARTGKPFVKLFSEEHDVTIFVIVDGSASMNAEDENGVSFFQKAVEVAALFLLAGFHLSCQAGCGIFNDDVKKLWLPKSGRNFIFSIVYGLKNFQIKNNSGSNLNAALSLANKILHTNSLIILISDFKINNYGKELLSLAKNHDIIALKIFSKNDVELFDAGFLPIYDSENKQTIFLNTSSKKVKAEYNKNFLQKLSAWENTCFDSAVLPCKMPLEANSVNVIYNFLLSAKSKNEAINKLKNNR